MQMERGLLSNRRAAVALGIMILVLTQQVCAGPVPYSDPVHTSSDQSPLSLRDQTMRVLRRTARKSPLWRVVGTKPLTAYCLKNYECSTRICRDGHCSSIRKPVTY